MSRGRLEAFSDAVIAILITIMVLELRTPAGPGWRDLRPLAPTLLTYLLSFVFLAIYWNNHHHMLHLVQRVDGRILWANMHLLFWLSLVPFVTRWFGEHHSASVPTAFYGVVMLSAALAWLILQRAICAHQGPGSRLRSAIGRDVKGKISGVLYTSSIPLAFVDTWISTAIYVLVAAIWLVPDRRFEAEVARG